MRRTFVASVADADYGVPELRTRQITGAYLMAATTRKISVNGLWVLVVLLALTACGDDDPLTLNGSPNQNSENQTNNDEEQAAICDELCDQVYNSCELVLESDEGTIASEDQCYTECLDDVFEGAEQCIINAGCDESAVAACFGAGNTNGSNTPNNDTNGELGDPCDATTDWPDGWAALEAEVVELTNQRRAEGAVCGGTQYEPVPPLQSQSLLQCAARRHSQDMEERSYFAHNSPEGESPYDRIVDTGYSGQAVGENIAAGATTAAEAVQGWMDSPGHCQNIMSASFNEIGVGYVEGPGATYGRVWTQKFGFR